MVHSGHFAARIERDASSAQDFSYLARRIPVTFTGDTLELRGWLKTESVEGFAGLWLRQDALGSSVQFDNMEDRGLAGTTAWTEYRIALPLDKKAKFIVFGALLSGRGKAWADDLRLLVDGRPYPEAPELVTAVSRDHEFDPGSRIDITPLSKIQIDDLVLLAKVWGFLKYHHPRVTSGQLNWDYELFRVLPPILGARDRKEATHILSQWVDRVGEPEPCKPCAAFPDSAYLPSPTEWIGDRRRLGQDRSTRLQGVHTWRSVRVLEAPSSRAKRSTPTFPSRMPVIDCWHSSDSGISSRTGFRTGTSSTRIGTTFWQSSYPA